MTQTPRDPRESTQTLSWWSPALAVVGGMLTLSFAAYAVVIGDASALETPWIAAGVAGVVLLVGWAYVEQDNLRRSTQSNAARYTATSWALIVVALGIAAALNVLANRYDQRIDLTESRRFTLSDQTLRTLDGLQEPVTVLAFFGTGTPEESDFRSIIEGYEQASDLLTVEFVDPNRNPLLAQQHEITTGWGTVILTAGDVDRRLENTFDEEAMTNALIQLTSGVEHIVCFSIGHQELDLQDNYTPTGAGLLAERLEALNYRVETVELFREAGVPDTCTVLIIADPQVEWLAEERAFLSAHVASGGHVLMMLEPGHTPQLAESFGQYGIAIGDDLILESGPAAQSFNGDFSYVILSPESFDFHPITQPLQAFTLHRIARSVGQGAPIDGINVQELARTTPSSWTKTDLENLTDLAPSDTDRMGPIPMMAVAEVTDPSAITVPSIQPPPGPDGEQAPAITPAVTPAAGAKVMVIGDIDFASNGLLTQGNNLDLIMNTIAWMAGETDQISIRPNESADGAISLNLIQGLLLWLICLLIAPGLMLLGALNTWRMRRQR